MRFFHYALGDGNVFVKRIVRGVDHHRAIETAVDTVVTGLLVTVIEVHRKNGIRKNFTGSPDDRFQHVLVCVRARALGNLDDERRLGRHGSLEKAHGLLGIVDVVRANGKFAIGDLEELGGGYDHGRSFAGWVGLSSLD